MKETFILANGINGTELKRTLANRGVNTFCVRFFTTSQLAKEALSRSVHKVEQTLINSNEEAAIIFSLMQDIDMFTNSGYADAKNVSNAFNTMRNLTTDSDELKFLKSKLLPGDFHDKNQALMELFEKHLNYLDNNNLVDETGLVKLAINNANAIDANFLYLNNEDIKPTPLEECLLNVLSNKNWKTTTFESFFGDNLKPASGVPNLIKAYGQVNEVEYIIDEIYKNHKFDECVIGCCNIATYSQHFFNLSLLYDIPITFGCGISIKNSNPFKLLSAMVKWDTHGYHGVDALNDILSNEAFDAYKFWNAVSPDTDLSSVQIDNAVTAAGQLKISTDTAYNQKVLSKIEADDPLHNFAKVLEQGIVSFVEKFTKIRGSRFEKLDIAAMQSIKNLYESIKAFNPKTNIDEIYEYIASTFVSKELSQPGALHITDIPGINCALRQNVYICGLSGNDFPGAAREDYLLLDCDINKFEGGVKSQQKVLNKIKSFNKTIGLAKAINANVSLSYSSYDLSELKEQNASSVLYDMYKDIDKAAYHVGYFDAHLSSSREIIKKYQAGTTIDYAWEPTNFYNEEDVFSRSWSPSAIEDYFSCPRMFYLSRILQIPQAQVNDPFEVIDPATTGTIAHKLMKFLGENKQISKESFLEQCVLEFDATVKNMQSAIFSAKQAAKEYFLAMMGKAYDQDIENKSQILASEQSITAKYEDTNIVLHGYVDRIEAGDTGAKVVDFKTGNTAKQEDNNPEKCLQALIYTYIWNSSHSNSLVVEGQYRYIKTGETITCRWDQASKEALDNSIRQFENALKTLDFPRCPGNACKFCTYKDVCLWPNDVNTDGDIDE